MSQLEIRSANPIFSALTGSGLELFTIRYKSDEDAGKTVIEFQVLGRAGQLKPVQVIVYQSMTAIARDSETHQQLNRTSETVMIDNVLLAYDRSLVGLTIEQQLRNQFEFIMGA